MQSLSWQSGKASEEPERFTGISMVLHGFYHVCLRFSRGVFLFLRFSWVFLWVFPSFSLVFLGFCMVFLGFCMVFPGFCRVSNWFS